MYVGIITFTFLWAVTCTILYLGLVRKNEEAFRKVNEANQLYDDALQKNAEAQRNLEDAIRCLQRIEFSLKCQN